MNSSLFSFDKKWLSMDQDKVTKVLGAIIFFFMLIISFVFYFRMNHYHHEENIPTLHAICSTNNYCGDDMTCDVSSKRKKEGRCKKKVGGSCSSDVDCEQGLMCSKKWKCVKKKE